MASRWADEHITSLGELHLITDFGAAPSAPASQWADNEARWELDPCLRFVACDSMCSTMSAFPSFMKHPDNRIAADSQNTDGVEGYVFDGVDGSQVAFWECPTEATTVEHIHAFDEYFLVVEGAYFLWLDGEERKVGPGQECFISKGTRIAGRVVAGTRTIHFFGAPRARRAASAEASSDSK